MNKKIIYKMENGGIAILHPAVKAMIPAYTIPEHEIDGEIIPEQTVPAETEEEFLQRIAEKDVPAGAEYRIVDASVIPSDRYFRDAWRDEPDTDGIDICIETAKDVHLNNLRVIRNEKFIAMGFPVRLDPDLEAAIIPAETRATLQALRDFPETIAEDLAAAETPEEIKEVVPEIFQ